MAVAPDTGMKKAEMRKLLTRSKEEPVTCAVGQGDNVGLMLLDKRKPGRALETALKAEFPDARNTRFGTAFVDVEDNPKLVKLTLNKPVTGMAKRLIKTLKGTGFSKVIILTEDGSVMEQFEEEDEEALVGGDDAGSATPPPPPPAPPPAAESAENKAARAADLIAKLKALSAQIPEASFGDETRLETFTKLARTAGIQIKTGNLEYGANAIEQLEKALTAPPPPPPAPPPPASPSDTAQRLAALAAQLKALVPQIAAAAGGDAARMALLAKLAKDAGVELKTGNLNYAANTIERLRTALENRPAAGIAPAAAAEARLAWTSLRAEIRADVETLRSALSQAYAGQPIADQIVSAFQAKVAPMLGRFDDRLGAALDGIAAENDAAKRADLTAGARALVGEYRAFAAGDALIGDLDDNPFVPLQIRNRAVTALSAMASSLGA